MNWRETMVSNQRFSPYPSREGKLRLTLRMQNEDWNVKGNFYQLLQTN